MSFERTTRLIDGSATRHRFPFQVNLASDLRVFLVDPNDLDHIPLTLDLDYQVSGLGDPDGGEIELTTAGRLKALEGLQLVLKKGPAYECQGSGGGVTPPAGTDYSFEEQWTGKYDLTDPDGPKKVYIKTFFFDGLTDSVNVHANAFIELGCSNLRKIKNFQGVLHKPSTYGFFNMPYTNTPYTTSVSLYVALIGSGVYNLGIRWIGTYSGMNVQGTVEYTKNE